MSNPTRNAERRTTSVQGLNEYRPAGIEKKFTGVYYSRYSMNGKPTFGSLGTSIYEHAKIKHAQRAVDVEKDRRHGADSGGQ